MKSVFDDKIYALGYRVGEGMGGRGVKKWERGGCGKGGGAT